MPGRLALNQLVNCPGATVNLVSGVGAARWMTMWAGVITSPVGRAGHRTAGPTAFALFVILGFAGFGVGGGLGAALASARASLADSRAVLLATLAATAAAALTSAAASSAAWLSAQALAWAGLAK